MAGFYFFQSITNGCMRNKFQKVKSISIFGKFLNQLLRKFPAGVIRKMCCFRSDVVKDIPCRDYTGGLLCKAVTVRSSISA
jgi:hypothetical protein